MTTPTLEALAERVAELESVMLKQIRITNDHADQLDEDKAEISITQGIAAEVRDMIKANGSVQATQAEEMRSIQASLVKIDQDQSIILGLLRTLVAGPRGIDGTIAP